MFVFPACYNDSSRSLYNPDYISGIFISHPILSSLVYHIHTILAFIFRIPDCKLMEKARQLRRYHTTAVALSVILRTGRRQFTLHALGSISNYTRDRISTYGCLYPVSYSWPDLKSLWENIHTHTHTHVYTYMCVRTRVYFINIIDSKDTNKISRNI